MGSRVENSVERGLMVERCGGGARSTNSRTHGKLYCGQHTMGYCDSSLDQSAAKLAAAMCRLYAATVEWACQYYGDDQGACA